MNTAKANWSGNLRIIWAIAAKDVVDALKNKVILGVMLGTAMVVLSGMAMPLLMGLMDRPPRAYIYAAEDSTLVEALRENRDFGLVPVSDPQEVQTIIGDAPDVNLGLVIPENIDEMVAGGGEIEIDGYIVYWAPPARVTELVTFFEEQFSQVAGQPVHINVDGHLVYPTLETVGQVMMVSSSFVIALVVIGIFLTPYLMIDEKEKHTMEALLVSPASYSQVVIGKALAGTAYCLAAAVVLLALNAGKINHWSAAILAALAGSLFTVALGLLMGTLFENPSSMNMFLGLVIIVLVAPVVLDTLPNLELSPVVTAIIPWMPSIGLYRVFRSAFVRDIPLSLVLSNIGIMVGFAVIVLALVVWRVSRMDR